MERIKENEKHLNTADEKRKKLENDTSCKEEDESFAKTMTGPQSSQPMTEKLLGVQWCTEEDCFVFDCKQFLDEEPKQHPTKKDVVRVTSKIYDPMGIITPLTVKLFCQSLFKKDIGWDERLDEESSNTWKLLQQELREATPIKIPRCYFNGVISEDITASLEGFCDSSVKAYATVVYLKLETRDGVQLNIVASNTRVAPLTKQSIPRLELLSALILARLITHIKEALKGYIDISSIRCWSDSEVALYWICGETHEWKQFVQNRVLEIRSLVPPELWNHCASKDNPADIPSRGTSPVELSNSMWFSGPEWLKIYTDPSEQTSMNENEPPEEVTKEMKLKKSKNPSETSSFNTTCEVGHIGEIIDCKRFSSLNKLQRTTAIVLKFIQILKSKRDPTVKAKPLTDYMLQAEELWLKDIQFQLMSKAKTRKWEREFGLYRDERGILRCEGRLKNAELTTTQKHPAILDAEHYVTSLIVRDIYEENVRRVK